MKDVKKVITHLNEHQDFPATKQELVEACNNLEMDGVTPEDKKWFEDHLPEGTYQSSDDVIRALGWQQPKTAQAM